MSIYKFRVLIESEEQVFRDIEINSEDSFDKLHEAILKAYNFNNEQLASFYESDDKWSKGKEIALVDMSLSDNETLIMSETPIKSVICCVGNHLLYTYDFLNMWNFFIELIEISLKENPEKTYPCVAYSFGEAPKQDSVNKVLSDEEIADELLKNSKTNQDKEKDIFDEFDDFDDFENYEENL